MNSPSFIYIYNNKEYNVFVSRRTTRSITFRLKEDGFHVGANRFTLKGDIVRGLNKFAPKLIKSYQTRNSNYSFEEDYLFLLGEKVSLSGLGIKNIEDLAVFLKKNAFENLTNLTRKYEEIMGIKKPYKVRVKNTSSRFGSNSCQTHSISYQIALVHYSPEIISSVVVHELAHDFFRNHQQKFYNCVNLYCPDYKNLQRKLKKGIHK